jgi:hypothetical protein
MVILQKNAKAKIRKVKSGNRPSRAEIEKPLSVCVLTLLLGMVVLPGVMTGELKTAEYCMQIKKTT